MIRAIIEIDENDLDDPSNISDGLTDLLIYALDSPNVSVLDVVEEGEPAWYRSSGF